MMNQKSVVTHLAAFAIGVLLTLLFVSAFSTGQYVTFDSARNRILDTQTGRLYVQGNGRWIVEVSRVGRK
jgi:hypothetical protein